ncbi:UDP-N-acetylmuramoyl-L-alanyl-D-glutamate--2,6-diaminopimelate ligase, partial [bacterium]|nr:UDP-N-acetylmuramoyl-L-alanyl-D-glutamate--2,6-diaminopimelate ligase [bacterium]
MMLNELIGNIEVDFIKGNVKKDIVNIAYNSSTVGSDWCFVAVSGLKADGHDFIDDAVARGATAIVSEFKVDLPEHVASVVVKDTRIALARISANYFNNPSLGMRLVGVTGTNGKTTITYLLESILQKSKSEPGVIGTVNYRYGGGNWPAQHTTPESYELQKLLRRMADSEVTDVVMEVSSHAIDMERIVGCHFDGAIFTNLSTEHLDYHGDIESYFATKARLFEECLMVSEKKNVWAVINWDDPRGKALVGGVACPVFKYGLLENSDVYTKNIRSSMDGIEMDVVTPIGTFSCSSRLIGTFNAYNILAAVAAAVAMGVELSEIKEGIESVSNVPGRMEYIENNRGIYAFVDYAHTPDALENVLSSI